MLSLGFMEGKDTDEELILIQGKRMEDDDTVYPILASLAEMAG